MSCSNAQMTSPIRKEIVKLWKSSESITRKLPLLAAELHSGQLHQLLVGELPCPKLQLHAVQLPQLHVAKLRCLELRLHGAQLPEVDCTMARGCSVQILIWRTRHFWQATADGTSYTSERDAIMTGVAVAAH